MSILQTPPDLVIRVLIVDDHPFVRAGVADILITAGGIEVVGESDDGSTVPALAARSHPHVVLMDLRMPKMSGIEATRALLAEQPDARVMMLTGSDGEGNRSEAADSGAVGFLLKGGDPDTLVAAVRRVANGGTAWPDDVPPAAW
ncbi:MAG TPA: response regulator transcription factor [Propionibacteriaceae bacterium]|nr:response regulator transcription factor [Propionibacteriaceae bacterium]